MPQELPLVSIVTPSLNKGQFIEETILSIKNQTYPNIEHIIVDGGSTDNTLDIIKKYDGSYNMLWLSEPDEGQSDAINKGWKMSTGEIIAYLNSDDTYMPWAVETVVEFMAGHPDIAMVYGDCNYVDEHGEVIRQSPASEYYWEDMVCGKNVIAQPSVFFRKEVLDKVGYLDTTLHYAMDLDLWVRIGSKLEIRQVPRLLANFRLCPGTKSVAQSYRFGTDHLRIMEKLFSDPELPEGTRKLKRRAYGHAHSMVGLGFLTQHKKKEAVRHFIKSVMLDPSRMVRMNKCWAKDVIINLVMKKKTQMPEAGRK